MSYNLPGGGSYGANLEKRARWAGKGRGSGGGGGGKGGMGPLGWFMILSLVIAALVILSKQSH